MTNAEKYKEVFGLTPDTGSCPTELCSECPGHVDDNFNCTCDWWNEEYKGNDTVKVEVTEVHTFAKPDDVSDIDFPSLSSEDK